MPLTRQGAVHMGPGGGGKRVAARLLHPVMLPNNATAGGSACLAGPVFVAFSPTRARHQA